MQSGRSRGFGFVYYEAPEDAREVGITAFVSPYSYVVLFFTVTLTVIFPALRYRSLIK